MVLSVTIPDDLAEELARAADAAGKTPAEITVAAIRRELLLTTRCEQALAPIRQAFRASGLTEDEAVDLFEAEKHSLRRERAADRP